MTIATYSPGFEFNCGIPANTCYGDEVTITHIGTHIQLEDTTGNSDGDSYVFISSEKIIHGDEKFLECVRGVVAEAMLDASIDETTSQEAANSIVYSAVDLQMPGRVSFSSSLLQSVLRQHMTKHNDWLDT